MAEGFINCHRPHKTIAQIAKLFLDNPDQYALAGFFHTSPWKPDDLECAISNYIIKLVVDAYNAGIMRDVTICIDDSTIEKYKDSTFELCEKVYDHAKKRYIMGCVMVSLRITFGKYGSFTLYSVPYISEKKVTQLNVLYPDGYTFKTKNEIARELLGKVFDSLPEALKIYVCFDKWYSSKDNIEYCLSNNATVICGLKSNRLFNGTRLSSCDSLVNEKWTKTLVHYRHSNRHYFTMKLSGKLNGIKNDLTIVASRLHMKSKRPVFFLCTDTAMKVQDILDRYAIRWECETDFLYSKKRIALGDFRVRSALSIRRYFAIQHFVLFGLQYRQLLKSEKKGRWIRLAEIIAQHEAEHEEQTKKLILKHIPIAGERAVVEALLS